MSVISWIGLGNMGSPMVGHFVKTGVEVRGVEINSAARDQAAAKGIQLVDTIADAVAGADAVFTMLPAGTHVREVLTGPEGVFAHVGAGAVVVDCSTIDIATARDMHAAAQRVSVPFVDAPVSGGTSGAEAGTLTFMAGGEREHLAVAEPFLRVMAGSVVPTGGPATGQAAKIVNNMILGTALAATCEGVVLAERLGLDPGTFYEIVTNSTGDNWALRNWYPAAGVVESAPSSRGFQPGFATALLEKDLGLALQAGVDTQTELPTAHIVLEQVRQLAESGGRHLDCSALKHIVADQPLPGCAEQPA